MTEPAQDRIEHVFCAFDFSETSEVALEQAKRFARRHRADLVLAHVVEPIPLGPYPTIAAANSELVIVDIAREKVESRAAALREEGFKVEAKVEQGTPGPQLVSIAESMDAALVVIGTRGLSGFRNLLMGSTTEYVVRKSPFPVLTVHPDDKVLRSAIETVVLPTDFSEGAASAVESFISIFGEWERPKVLLIYADRTPPYLDPFKHEILEKMNAEDVVKDEIEQKLAPIAEHLRAADFEVEVSVLDGDPVSVTTHVAKERDADLILLSTKGRGALVNALVGRTAQRIVRHAPCPVLTVGPPSASEDD